MGPSLSNYKQDLFKTLADEDTNSIPTDDVNRAFLGNVANIETNASGSCKKVEKKLEKKF